MKPHPPLSTHMAHHAVRNLYFIFLRHGSEAIYLFKNKIKPLWVFRSDMALDIFRCRCLNKKKHLNTFSRREGGGEQERERKRGRQIGGASTGYFVTIVTGRRY